MSESDPLVKPSKNSSGNVVYGGSSNPNTQQPSEISKLKDDVGVVIDLTRDNLEKVLERDTQIDDLMGRSENLEATSVTFQRHSKKLRWQTCRQNYKLWGIMALIIIVLIIIIASVAAKK